MMAHTKKPFSTVQVKTVFQQNSSSERSALGTCKLPLFASRGQRTVKVYPTILSNFSAVMTCPLSAASFALFPKATAIIVL
uniref:Uncharacterized protein n=1 Tax=Candidatus Kentrum eta TaxID=2126337 RepID=A0A450VF50_9GAMM|nr:MAG: hypothetical protein BECKH772A_GA0070896_101292 [Candidatus Kentron sp. H]VFJ98331.1 MAG: hypothetical protein BECKH772B_GA0070898_101319 [Candidatus Kentron sp. H]VFK03404.1 MAG: hypothetical protein BECKH772C_GA0070978_101279 [Candidatus Kentron sp. H]